MLWCVWLSFPFCDENLKIWTSKLGEIQQTHTLSTLAGLTLIILFSEMLKFSKIISSKSKNIVKENSGFKKNIPFVEMNVSKLISYSTCMCWNGQGTTIKESGGGGKKK